MVRLASQMMNSASIALHQTDLAVAGLVITDCHHMAAMLAKTECHCFTLIAPHDRR
jgi:hypothetical protein